MKTSEKYDLLLDKINYRGFGVNKDLENAFYC
jgi:hypothetical protein